VQRVEAGSPEEGRPIRVIRRVVRARWSRRIGAVVPLLRHLTTVDLRCLKPNASLPEQPGPAVDLEIHQRGNSPRAAS